MARQKGKLITLAKKETCSFDLHKVEVSGREDEYIFSFHISSYLVPEALKKRKKK